MIFEKVDIDQRNFEEKASSILKEVLEILIKKNKDYGGASFDMGLIGNYIHLHDKENRLKSLIENIFSGEITNFESIEDTYKDLIGYSVIGLIIFEAMNQKKKTGGQLLNEYYRGTSFAIQSKEK